MTVQTKATLLANIAADLADNVTGDISPQDVRDILVDIVDTMASTGSDNAFVSANQTITSAGSLTIAHGLSSTPEFVLMALVCTTAQAGYSVNDVVFVNDLSANQNDVGVSIVPDGTNLNVRYGSKASVFTIPNKTTGDATALTNANWRLRLIARL